MGKREDGVKIDENRVESSMFNSPVKTRWGIYQPDTFLLKCPPPVMLVGLKLVRYIYHKPNS